MKKILISLTAILFIGIAYFNLDYKAERAWAAPCFVNAGCNGVSSVPLGSMLYGSTTNQSLLVLPIGSSNQVLTVSGGVPTWQNSSGGGTSSTTINGLLSSNFNLVATDTVTTSYTISTSSPSTVTINLPKQPYLTACSQGCDILATSTIDGSTLTAAVNALNALGGGELFIKAGTYNITSQFSVFNATNITIAGEGAGTILKFASSSGFSTLNISTSTNITIKDLHFDGSSQATFNFNADKLLNTSKSNKNINIKDNAFTNCNGFCMFLNSFQTKTGTTTNITVTGNYIQGTGRQDAIGGGTNATGNAPNKAMLISNNQIEQPGAPFPDRACIDIVPFNEVAFNNNHCNGIAIPGNEQEPHVHSEINNNVFAPPTNDPNGFSGVFIWTSCNDCVIGGNATQTPLNLSVIGNTIFSGGIQVLGTSTNPTTNLLIADNNIYMASSTASTPNQQYCIEMSNVINSKVTNNTCTSYVVGDAGTIGIYWHNTNSGNISSNNTINGMAVGQDMGSGSGDQDLWNNYTNNTIKTQNDPNIITMNSTGLIGINTSNPTVGLTLQNGQGAGALLIGGDVNATTLTANVRHLSSLVMPSWDAGAINTFIFRGDITSATSSDLYIGGEAGGTQYAMSGLHFVTGATSTTTGGTESLTVTSAGNVGIGTTGPISTLAVTGNIYATGNITCGGSCGGGGGGGGVTTTTPFTAGYIPEATGTNVSLSNSNIFQSTAGNIGIGTASPSTVLHVIGVSTLQSGQATGALILGADVNASTRTTATRQLGRIVGTNSLLGGNNIGIIGSDSASAENSQTVYIGGFLASASIVPVQNIAMILGASTSTTGGIQLFNINSNGVTGINTTTPSAMLAVQSTTTIDSFNVASSSGASQLIVKSSGNVGIATTTPAYKLVVAGTVQLPGITTSSSGLSGYLCVDAANQVVDDTAVCVTVSAKRYKNYIGPLEPGLDELMQLKPVSFYYKPDTGMTPNLQYGLFADDVAMIDHNLAVYTDATTTFEGKTYPIGTPQGLAPENTWLGLLVNSIQQQQKEIENLPQYKTVKKSFVDDWQNVALGILFAYVIYNEIDKRKKK